MAINTIVLTKSGINISEAYVVVTNISYAKDSKSIITYQIWLNKESRDKGLEPILFDTHAFNCNIESSLNIVCQAYESLKLRDDFKNSVNV